jgi:hypothetical protein
MYPALLGYMSILFLNILTLHVLHNQLIICSHQWKQVYISADETKREREKHLSTAEGTTGQARKWRRKSGHSSKKIVEADGKKMQGTQMEQNIKNNDGSHRRKHQGGSPPRRSRSTSAARKTPPLRRNSQPKMTTTRRGSQSTKPAKK